MGQYLNIHRFLPLSLVNGPGRRAVIWTQGCSLRCPGCFNPETHPFDEGERISVDDLFNRLAALEGDIEGITISGGEPLDQYDAVAYLVKRISGETGLSIVLFTGYTLEEIGQMPESGVVLGGVDVLISGRFDENKRLARGLTGSSNQAILFQSERYSPSDLALVPEGEIVINPDGTVELTGIDPLHWES